MRGQTIESERRITSVSPLSLPLVTGYQAVQNLPVSHSVP